LKCQRCSQENREKLSLHPIGDENIRFVRGLAVAIRGPDETLAVGGKHREGVEVGMISDLLEAGAVDIDGVEVEAAGVFLVRYI
jgi:hypothetical protein